MTGEYIGAIDQGTTGTRFVIFDGAAEPVADAFTSHTRRMTPPDRVEYDPMEIWASATDAVGRGLRAADVGTDDLAALAVANQRQTSLLWDRATGEPVTPAISWQDRRTADRVAAMDAGTTALIRERTGLVPDPYFAAPTLEWLLDEGGAGDLRARARAGEVAFGTVDAWLVSRLTGEHATDVTNAAQTMLFDIHDLAWDEDLLAAFDVPPTVLPEVRPSSDPEGFGRTDPDGTLGASVPVAGVLGDQQAVLLGQAGFAAGDAKVTYGSGNFFLQNTGSEPVTGTDDLLTTVWFQRAGEEPWYGLEGPVFTTGAALEWLETVGLLEDTGGADALAGGVDDPDGVAVVPAFTGLGAPDWTPGARAAVFGLSRHTRREHLVRATLESIAFGTRAVVEAAGAATGVDHDRLLVDGGAIYDDAFAALQADLLGTSLARAGVTQTTALGAAFAAGLAVGTWDSLSAVREVHDTDRVFRPTDDRASIEERYRRWLAVVEAVRSFYAGGT
jgi:glycerol kinase